MNRLRAVGAAGVNAARRFFGGTSRTQAARRADQRARNAANAAGAGSVG